jgi:hypothetical protein
MKIYVEAMEALMKRKDIMELNLPPKLFQKLVWVVILLSKIFILTYTFDAL